jgi:hypothetical protein
MEERRTFFIDKPPFGLLDIRLIGFSLRSLAVNAKQYCYFCSKLELEEVKMEFFPVDRKAVGKRSFIPVNEREYNCRRIEE